MREETEISGCGDVTRQLAGEMQILGDDVEGAAGGEGAGQHRARDVVEGAAGPGAERHDPGQHAGIDPGLGADQQPFECGDEVGVAEVLGDELGDAAGARSADIEDVAGDRFEQRPTLGEDRFVAADHDRHPRRAPADRRIEHVDPLGAAGLGHPARHRGSVGGQIDVDAAGAQPGQDAGRRIEHGGLHLVGAGQRSEHDFAALGYRAGMGGDGRAPLGKRGCCFGPDIVDAQLMAGVDQTARDRRPHRAGADKSQLHRMIPLFSGRPGYSVPTSPPGGRACRLASTCRSAARCRRRRS